MPRSDAAQPQHFVQFYESPEFLCERVADFLQAGLSAREPVIAIVTEARRGALMGLLGARGLDVAQLLSTGELVLLDARKTLGVFMVDGMPDWNAFVGVVGTALTELGARHACRRVRAYGEMVDVLWSEGNATAAVRLEEFWRDLQKAHQFSLLCAYVMGNFYKANDLLAVCAAHDHVLPLETRVVGPDLAHETLQSLAAEIAHRAEVERTLRESIGELRRTEMELRRSQTETSRLVRVTAAIADAVTPDEVFEAVVDQVAAALGASTAGLWLLHDGESTANLVRSVGYSEDTKKVFGAISLHGEVASPVIDTLLSGKPTFIASRDELLERYPEIAPSVKMQGSYRTACLPVAVQGRIAGLLGFTFDNPAPFDSEERGFLMHVARHSGQALERLMLLDADKQARMRAELLYRLAASVIEAEEVDGIFAAALEAIEEGLQSRRSSILVYDPDGVLRFKAWRGLSDGYRSAVEGHSPWARDVRAPEPIFIGDVTRAESMVSYRNLFRKEGIGAIGFIPLVAGGRLVGKFMVYYDQPREVTRPEQSMARAIANHVAAAVERFAAVNELKETVRFNEMFTAILGHDLRNPLGAIMTAAQLLSKRDEGGKQRTTVARILRSGDRMARMIDQLLDFTRVRVGDGIPLRTNHLDLTVLLRQVLDELDDANPECTLDLTHRGSPLGVWDEDRLCQVFSNLVGNAVQHGVANEQIRVLVDGTSADSVRIEVHNGASIPDDLLPRLFDPMVGGAARRERSQGLGLGLFISQEIVKAHRGSIDVRSATDTGTTFVVTLPRLPPPEREKRGAR